HRWKWDEWCDAKHISRQRIPEVKELAYEGFLLARQQSVGARDHGAFLIDEQYASAIIARALADGIEVGTPAEQPGVFPLTWTTEPFARALTGAFVKVLIRYRPDYPADVRDEQFNKLLQLQTWCRAARKP